MKKVESFSLPQVMQKQIQALVDSGFYSSKSDVVKDAMRVLLETKPHLNLKSARILYKQKFITLDEALYLTGKTKREFLK